MKSFLMLGQSNMAGRGDFGEVPEIVNPHCFMLRNGRWQPMKEPINTDRGIWDYFHSGVGLAASFAEEYANHYHEDIGLIPCAEGGSAIAEWQPGGLLYDHAVMQAGLAMRTSELCGILWHQGEQDAIAADTAQIYRERLENVFRSLRRDLGMPHLPIVMGELGEYLPQNTNLPYSDEINRTITRIAEDLPDVGLASARGLACKEDGLHFNSASCREFGRRYFAVYQGLVGDSCTI